MNEYLLVFMLPFGIHREPTFQDPFALVEQFFDGPERRKREYAQQRRQKDIGNE